MVQRYKFSDEYGCHVENDRGDLVTYQDYRKLEAELEQLRQQVEASEDDGWLEWGGGAQPVADNERVEVRFRDGFISGDAACGLEWCHYGLSVDIIAYRIVRK